MESVERTEKSTKAKDKIDFFERARYRVQQGNYVEAILQLQCLDDDYRGFDTSIQNFIYFRTQRIDEPSKKYNGWVNYAILGLNLLYALDKVKRLHKKPAEHHIALNYLDLLKEHSTNFFDIRLLYKLLHEEVLIPEIKRIYKKENNPLQILYDIRALNHIDFPCLSLQTQFAFIYDSQTFYITISDRPCTILTAKILEEYKNYETRSWFKNISPQLKPYVEAAIQVLLKTNDDLYPVLPASLRHLLPGIKCAYQEDLYLQRPDQTKPEKIFAGFHMAHPGHLTCSENNTELTQKSLEQLKFHIRSNTLFVHTLMSPNDVKDALWQRKQSALSAQCNKAISRMSQIYFSNHNTDMFRTTAHIPGTAATIIATGLTEQYQVLSKLQERVESFNHLMQTKTKEKDDFLTTLKEKTSEENQESNEKTLYFELIDNIDTLLHILKQDVSIKKQIEYIKLLNNQVAHYKEGSSSTELVSGNNHNLKLVAHLKEVFFAYEKLYQTLSPSKQKKEVLQADACLTGTDKDSVLRLYTYAYILITHIGGLQARKDCNDTKLTPYLIAIAQSAHLQKLSALSTTLGGYGLHSDAQSSIISGHQETLEPYFFKSQAARETIPPTPAKKYAPFVQHNQYVSKLRKVFKGQITKQTVDSPSLSS